MYDETIDIHVQLAYILHTRNQNTWQVKANMPVRLQSVLKAWQQHGISLHNIILKGLNQSDRKPKPIRFKSNEPREQTPKVVGISGISTSASVVE